MIDLLVFHEALVYCFFDWPNRPEEGPGPIVIFVVFSLGFDIPKAVVFHGVANDLDVTVVQIEKVAIILGKVWPYCHWILIGTEH